MSLLGQSPIMTRRRLRVVCIGAGFAGLMLAHRVKQHDFIDLCIYEKNAGIGGTWFENKYPGAACDVPSHIYTFPFAPNPNWSRFYAQSAEILAYINDVADRFGLRDVVQLDSRVVSAVWSDANGKWTVTIERPDGTTFTDDAEILVNGSGILNHRKLPDIPGLKEFQGPVIHSAAWDDNLNWDGKRVGVIGNGSSAIQILPQMQPTAAKVIEFIRGPTWIIPDFLADFTPEGKNFEYTEEQKQHWRENPLELRELRRKMEHAFNTYFGIFIAASPAQAAVREAFTALMKQKLNGDEDLAAQLIPDFPVGCRRITPGNGYLEALQMDNVSVNRDAIQRITRTGVVTAPRPSQGKAEEHEEELDILVCATGFNVSFCPAWEMRGRHSKSLNEIWRSEAEGYLGIFAPDSPNYFIYNGPNCPIGHGSLMGAMDATTDLIISLCTKIASQDIKSFCVKPDVIREYNDYSQEFLRTTVWNSGCRSWYKNDKIDGKVTAMYAGSVLHYRQMLANIRLEDFEYNYCFSNRFSFMGNGITQTEAEGKMLGDYLEH